MFFLDKSAGKEKTKPRNLCGIGVFALEPIARLELATC